MEESVRGIPTESAKVKSPASPPTRSFCTLFKRLLQPNRRSAAPSVARDSPPASSSLFYIVIPTVPLLFAYVLLFVLTVVSRP